MTDTRKAMQQALEALSDFARFQSMMMDGPDDSDRMLAEDYAEAGFKKMPAAIKALREALAQQPELSTASKSEQLLASQEHALRAEFQRMKAALAQQGEPLTDEQWLDIDETQPLHVEAAPAAQPDAKQAAEAVGQEFAKVFGQAAPAAQPTCKQDLQVPTVKESLSVETEQERYVRMCPDIGCGRKKQCTRMVGVSCMSRADIAPAAQPLTEMKLLMITTAYEQGVGKGIQRRNANPYAEGTDEHRAWAIGYEEGLDKPAAPEAQQGADK